MALAVATDVASRDSFWCSIAPSFPDNPLPLDIYGPLEVKQIVNGSVGIGLEL